MSWGLGDYFGQAYFGGTVPRWIDQTGRAAAVPIQPRGDTLILRWVYDQILALDLFSTVAIGRNPGPYQPDRAPLAWIYPVGFNERNDAADLAIRQTSIAVRIEVETDRDGATIPAYSELEILAGRVVDQVETGPDWVDPSPGGLLSGRYDPPRVRGNSSTGGPLDRIDLELIFAYFWGRGK